MSPGALLVEIVGSIQLAALGAVQFLSHNGKYSTGQTLASDASMGELQCTFPTKAS